jgi:small subunit ribosomal protein S9
MTETATVITATGRRKRSTARIRLIPNGSGSFTVNGKEMETYCYYETLARAAEAPLVTVELKGKFDVVAKVQGGGPNGQATAVAHGLARALEKFDSELRSPLKKAGHLKRDPRRRERKKAGQPGARKRFQFSKR